MNTDYTQVDTDRGWLQTASSLEPPASPPHLNASLGCNHYHITAAGHARVHAGDVFQANKARLRYTEGAAYDTKDQVPRACHPATRTELLRAIRDWATDPASKSIFWLNGMAGTGKSTISYTIARSLAQSPPSGYVRLGASFFFKRGEGDRASAALFFPTIVHQLAQRIPGLDRLVDDAVKTDPSICSKSLGEQFDKLLQRPLQALDSSQRRQIYVIVVDALDECDCETDIRSVLQLWSSLSRLTGIYLRLLLTSRPELPIRLEFKRMLPDLYQNMILHEVPQPVIQHDIFAFLMDAFTKIREDYNYEPLSGAPLGDEWPGTKVMQELTDMAVPLFVIAATIYRFIHDADWDPQERLETILQSRKMGQMSPMAQTYLPVLQHLTSSSRDSTDQQRLYSDFQTVAGAIVTLAEPLSRTALAALLQLPISTISVRLRPLYSVLDVPLDTTLPIRPLHLSFGEFLTSSDMQSQPFGIDGPIMHSALLGKCLQLLSGPSPAALHENICNLDHPGQSRHQLTPDVIEERLPSAVRYACRYWTYHAQSSGVKLYDEDQVHKFLQKHFLYWLEALSLLDRLADAISYVGLLQTILSPKNSTNISSFLEDARRFILTFRAIGDLAPLQLYSSAIVFSPQSSTVRQLCGHIPAWIQQCPITPAVWSLELQKLEGHTDLVTAVAFSPDGSLLASASRDKTVRVWSASTGQEVQRLEGHTSWVNAVAFSPDGSLLASASYDKTVRIWSASTRQEVQKLEGHTDWVTTVAFSPDGSLLASASRDDTVRVWSVSTGQEVQRLEGHTKEVEAVAFSLDSSLLASASRDKTVRVWSASTGQEVQRLEGHTKAVTAVAFSPDGSLLASASYDKTVRIWSASTGQEVQRLEGHTSWVNAVAFSLNGSLLASASRDDTVRVWSASTGQEVQRLEGHTSAVTAVAFSPDSSLLASASGDKTVRVWSASTGQEIQKMNDVRDITQLTFTLDGTALLTNKGHIRIDRGSGPATVLDPQIDHLLQKQEWIEYCGKRLLWLPHEYRTAVSALRNSTFAFGQANGSVSFLRISYP